MDIRDIQYQRMGQGHAERASAFISGVFGQCVAKEFSQDGVDEFLAYIRPEALSCHLNTNHFGLIASAGPDDRILGVILVRDDSHISLFFVDVQYQGMGIGRELISRVLDACQASTPKQITVNASLNSIHAYEVFGFKPTDTEQCVNGIRFVPMVRSLS